MQLQRCDCDQAGCRAGRIGIVVVRTLGFLIVRRVLGLSGSVRPRTRRMWRSRCCAARWPGLATPPPTGPSSPPWPCSCRGGGAESFWSRRRCCCAGIGNWSGGGGPTRGLGGVTVAVCLRTWSSSWFGWPGRTHAGDIGSSANAASSASRSRRPRSARSGAAAGSAQRPAAMGRAWPSSCAGRPSGRSRVTSCSANRNRNCHGRHHPPHEGRTAAIRRTASSMICSLVPKLSLTQPLPWAPKPGPGSSATRASRRKRSRGCAPVP